MALTPKQASRSLAALDNLLSRVEFYAEIGDTQYRPYIWEREAVARLRWHLMAMLPDGDPQLAPKREPE